LQGCAQDCKFRIGKRFSSPAYCADLPYRDEQVLLVAAPSAQHVGVVGRATDTEDREQEASLKYEAVAIPGNREPMIEAFKQIELE